MQRRLNGTGAAAMAGLVIVLVMVASPAAAQPRWGRPRSPRAGACFYRDAHFRGDYFCVAAGEDVPEMPRGMNDEISSIQTFGDVEVEIYQDVRYRGRAKRFSSGVGNLGDDWNDRLSSIRVSRLRDGDRGRDRDRDRDRYDGRDDRGRHEVVTRPQAEDIVRRAYLSVLKREPDPASRGFVDRVLNERWTQADVERELRNSDEYRRKR
jgi:hypothetical protein